VEKDQAEKLLERILNSFLCYIDIQLFLPSLIDLDTAVRAALHVAA